MYKRQGLGIAPIGHKVTVSTPLPRTINVSGKITLLPGYKLETLMPDIKDVYKRQTYA